MNCLVCGKALKKNNQAQVVKYHKECRKNRIKGRRTTKNETPKQSKEVITEAKII